MEKFILLITEILLAFIIVNLGHKIVIIIEDNGSWKQVLKLCGLILLLYFVLDVYSVINMYEFNK